MIFGAEEGVFDGFPSIPPPVSPSKICCLRCVGAQSGEDLSGDLRPRFGFRWRSRVSGAEIFPSVNQPVRARPENNPGVVLAKCGDAVTFAIPFDPVAGRKRSLTFSKKKSFVFCRVGERASLPWLPGTAGGSLQRCWGLLKKNSGKYLEVARLFVALQSRKSRSAFRGAWFTGAVL